MTLVAYTVAAGAHKGKVVWIVADSQSAADALEAYSKSPKTHGMMSQIISQALKGLPLDSEAFVQIVVTPSHRFSIINKGADWGCSLQPQLRGDRMFRRFFHYAPSEVTSEVFQFGPRQTKAFLLARHSAALEALHDLEFSDHRPFGLGRGIPVEWLSFLQQKHAQRQRMSCISTMEEHHRRWGHRDFHWDPFCLICGRRDTRTHSWECLGSEELARYVETLVEGLRLWLKSHWYRRRPTGPIWEETFDPECLVVWSMATKTSGFVDERLSTASRGSLGTRFLAEVITASLALHTRRAEAREQALRAKQGTTLSLAQYMQRAFRDAERGILQRRQDQPPPETEETDSETDGEGWETDSGGHQSEGGFSDFSDPDPEDPGE